MTSEQTSLHRRAACHAALGDVVRLRIVDLLAVGDLSVGQLRQELGIAPNLLSHHLAVLTRAGLVGEHRSEGDGRRKYLHLLAGMQEAAAELAPISARRLLFVCTGNSARSPLAAALWGRASSVPATSAGIHPAPSVAGAFREVAARHGIRLDQHRPRALGEVTHDGDLIVTLCDRAYEGLGAGGGLHWSVPNPSPVGTAAAYEAAFHEISIRVHALAPHVRAA
jgi:protein-tyrosine-phosphatase/DNA-binding transcriptional ArsR family regulator